MELTPKEARELVAFLSNYFVLRGNKADRFGSGSSSSSSNGSGSFSDAAPTPHGFNSEHHNAGPLSPANGGTGVNNGVNELTVPTTGTAAILETSNAFLYDQAIGIVNNISLLGALQIAFVSPVLGVLSAVWADVDSSTSTNNYSSFDLSTAREGANAVLNNDILGQLNYWGMDDLSTRIKAASIQTRVSGTVSSSIVPGQLEFYTTDNTGALVLAMLLDAAQNLKLENAGSGIYIKEGSNATMGVVTLVAGTITVNNTKVTNTSRIFLTIQELGTVTIPQNIAITARNAGTDFTITSSDNTDTSIIAWHIIEPS